MKINTRKLIDNHNEGRYLSDVLFVGEFIKELKAKHPDDERIKEVSNALIQIIMYVNSLHLERSSFQLILDEKFKQMQELRNSINDRTLK